LLAAKFLLASGMLWLLMGLRVPLHGVAVWALRWMVQGMALILKLTWGIGL
jgi:hypothetical protein